MAAWGMEPDMENRDPNNINDHLKVKKLVLLRLLDLYLDL